MKFTASTTDLQRLLSIIGGVIPAKSTLPILENFLFQVSGDRLQITATDLDTAMTVTTNVKDTADGAVAIPAKRLFETVRALPSTDVTFTIEPANNRITMSTENGEYKLTGESSENYPAVTSFKGNEKLDIDDETLRRLIAKSSFAVGTDELRPAMMGILFQIRKEEIRTVATDGHRLVRLINSAFRSSGVEREVVIPARALNLVLRSANDSRCAVSFGENHVLFAMDDTTLITRLIEEKYPNYESVIPLENDKKLIVDKGQLLSSVRRTALYASSTTHQIRFSIKKGSLAVSAEDIDFGSEARESLSCEYAGEPMEIGFNSSYIVDVLSHVDTDEVQFMLSTPTRASIVQPTTQRDGEDLLMLVMPVRINA